MLIVASSKIASLLLPGGRTVHLRFKISIQIDEYFICEIKKDIELIKLIKSISLIV